MIDVNIFRNNLRRFFEPHIFSRGLEYYRGGSVEGLKVFPSVENKDQIEIKGKVAGGDYYHPVLFFDIKYQNFSLPNCDCPYYDHCKHVAALGLVFIDLYKEFVDDPKLIFGKDESFKEKIIEWINSNEMFSCDNEELEPEKFKSADFSIVINSGHDLSARIHKKDGKDIDPRKILKNYSGIKRAQRAFFELLRDSHDTHDGLDCGEFFNLAKESGIGLFIQAENHWESSPKELSFYSSFKKIKAELLSEKREGQFGDSLGQDFIFKLDKSCENKSVGNSGRLLFGRDHIVLIDSNNTLHLQKIPSHIMGIISRIELSRNYHRGYKDAFLQTVLKEEDIIKLNQIIKDGKKYLSLKTTLKPNYNIKEFKKTISSVIVDYDADKSFFEIRASVDYGFYQQDVSETIRYSKNKGKRPFAQKNPKVRGKYIIEMKGKDIFYALVDAQQEVNVFESYYNKPETGFSLSLKCKRQGEIKIFEFFENHWPEIKKIAKEDGHKIVFLKDKFDFTVGDFKADFNVDLNAENDWLWFDVNCYCGKEQVNMEDLKRYAANKKEFIRTNDGKILRIENIKELEKFIMMLESFYAKKTGGFEGKLYHATELEDIFTSSKYYNAKLKQSFSKFIKEAKSGRPVEKVKLPAKLNKTLRDYQKTGIDWFYFLRKYRFAGILADDMGLGKTLQALVLVDMTKTKGKPSVVVCPKTLLYNWQKEAAKFTPDLKTIVIDGSPKDRKEMIKVAKDYDLIITGYATMKKDADIYESEGCKFNYCILDEAQFIKNHATKNAQIVKKISADFRLALTGTPLENSVSEIWSIFDFLMPGFLGSYGAFVKKYANPIMKNNNTEALGHLRKKIECFMLRRTKQEVLPELPPKIEQTAICHLEKDQNILYQEILSNVRSEIFQTVKEQGFNKSQIHILAALMKLRQVCNHPVLLLKDKDYSKYESAKLNMFLELIDEIIGNKRKVLVFSQFTQMLDILAKELDKKKVKYNYLSGKTKKRHEVVDDFNENDKKQVFLISLRAGGTGLNLTSADNVIIFDPWWNPSVENQAIDRTHRIGQKNSVNVYRLIIEGTIEDKIVKLQEKKKFLFDNLIGESKDLFKKLTWDEIKGLFD